YAAAAPQAIFTADQLTVRTQTEMVCAAARPTESLAGLPLLTARKVFVTKVGAIGSGAVSFGLVSPTQEGEKGTPEQAAETPQRLAARDAFGQELRHCIEPALHGFLLF